MPDPVTAALVTGLFALVVSVVTGLLTLKGARTSRAATEKAAEIAAEVKRQQERLSRLLVPVVAPSMIEAIKLLWQETYTFPAAQTPAAQTPAGSKTPLERRTKFVQDLSTWYYKDGNGLFLSEKTRDALFRVRCYALRPEEAEAAGFNLDYEQYGPKPFPESDEKLSKSLIEQASALRTALKDQLGIYDVWSEAAKPEAPQSQGIVARVSSCGRACFQIAKRR